MAEVGAVAAYGRGREMVALQLAQKIGEPALA
jgi:hypothetical protein